MNTDVPYMISAKNLPAILDKVQKAGVPDAFGLDFLRDLGYTSSNDRGVIKVLKYLGMLDDSGRPQASYRESPAPPTSEAMAPAACGRQTDQRTVS